MKRMNKKKELTEIPLYLPNPEPNQRKMCPIYNR